jgi:AcrR family transcriptional regulator
VPRPASETPTRNPAARSTRDRLIDAAAKSFVAEGYATVSVRQLAKRTSLTSGAIYGNFDSKSDLLMEVIDARIHQQLDTMARDTERSMSDVLAELYASFGDRTEMRALLIEGAAAARSDPDVRRRLLAGQRAILDTWGRDYRALQDHGDIDADLDPEAVLRLLWAMELGLGVLEAIGVDLPEPEQAARIVGRMSDGLAPPKPARGRKAG